MPNAMLSPSVHNLHFLHVLPIDQTRRATDGRSYVTRKAKAGITVRTQEATNPVHGPRRAGV